MPKLLPLDELNNLQTRLQTYIVTAFAVGKRPRREDIIDEMLDLYLLAYSNGMEDAKEMLQFDGEEWQRAERAMSDPKQMQDTIFRKVADKDFADRVDGYLDQNLTEDELLFDLVRIADTDSHRIYNESARGSADASGVEYRKTWRTMRDDRVRDTHFPLEGVTLDMEDDFYTFDGDSASEPGAFMLPENNISCRCWLEYTRI